jgi:hypothetical protein
MTQTIDVLEAARRLGITPDAVRARLRRGSIEGYRDNTGNWRTNMMSDPNRLEHFSEQFAIASFLAFVSSGAALLFVLVTTVASAI